MRGVWCLRMGIERAEGHVCGVPSLRKPEWGVRQLIAGGYSEAEQQPDPDLGKTVSRGSKHEKYHDENRIFGVPTIRTDITHGRLKSVADNQNYGDEPDVFSLLRPLPFSDQGVNEEDFLQRLSAAQMQDFMAKACIEIDEKTFARVFERAAAMDHHSQEGEASSCSIEAFRRVLHATKLES